MPQLYLGLFGCAKGMTMRLASSLVFVVDKLFWGGRSLKIYEREFLS